MALKAWAHRAVAQAGLPRWLHRALPADRLTIVMYHAVVREPLPVTDWCFLEEAAFRDQLDYLARHFEVLFLSEAVERLRSGRFRRPTAAITFDDGFQNNCDVAWPALRERGLPATVFLVRGLIGTQDTVWYCRFNSALARARGTSLDWDGTRYDLSGPAARAAAGAALQARLKALPHPRLLAALDAIVRELGLDPQEPMGEESPYRMLSPEAIARMAASGLVEFGAHTHSHAILARLPSVERDIEIDRSLAAVAQLTGRPCRLFAYPNGSAEDYDAATVQALAERGVEAAVTTRGGPNGRGTPALELRRYGVGASVAPADFRLAVHHWSRAARA